MSFGMSLDGFSAGPNQSLDNPLGERGPEIMKWFFPTHVFKTMVGAGDGEKGVDNAMAEKGFENVGANILGRNMFSPIRGPWPDESWRGWWGDEPPYHSQVFVLTHHARPSLVMKGGTTFHFVTDGIHAALERAREAAGGRDIRIGGGTATVRQFLQARLIDELHIPVSPVLVGAGENLMQGLDLRTLGYQVHQTVAGERATHMFLHKIPIL
jgi:dihydrofolate reductase